MNVARSLQTLADFGDVAGGDFGDSFDIASCISDGGWEQFGAVWKFCSIFVNSVFRIIMDDDFLAAKVVFTVWLCHLSPRWTFDQSQSLLFKRYSQVLVSIC